MFSRESKVDERRDFSHSDYICKQKYQFVILLQLNKKATDRQNLLKI